jgi:hypothetical protein
VSLGVLTGRRLRRCECRFYFCVQCALETETYRWSDRPKGTQRILMIATVILKGMMFRVERQVTFSIRSRVRRGRGGESRCDRKRVSKVALKIRNLREVSRRSSNMQCKKVNGWGTCSWTLRAKMRLKSEVTQVMGYLGMVQVERVRRGFEETQQFRAERWMQVASSRQLAIYVRTSKSRCDPRGTVSARARGS